MSEIEDLVGIYGAIDRAVMEDEDRRARVARLLPVYQSPDVHWFDDFEEWTVEKREEGTGRPFPLLPDALHELAEIMPRGRMRARRLFAIAVAAQAFPELRDPESDLAAMARDALQVESIAGWDEPAGRLLELLGDESTLPRSDDAAALNAWWERVINSGLVMEPATMGPRVCTGRLVMVPDVGGPVATLETEFETDAIDFDRAIRFLEPQNWPHCSSFWCEMRPLRVRPDGVHEYHEVVSLNCPNRPRTWTIQAELDFRFWEIDNQVAMTVYGLTQGVPQPDVIVDSGTLEVREIGSPGASRLKIFTTKRIKFNRPFSGEALAMIMCALGYAYIAEDLVFSCALIDRLPGTDFPGRPLATVAEGAGEGAVRIRTKPETTEERSGSKTPPSSTRPRGAGPDPAPVVDDFADRVATAVKECIDDSTKAFKESYKKMVEGRYDSKELAQDMADMWSRMAREWTKAIDLAQDGARTADRAQRRQSSGR